MKSKRRCVFNDNGECRHAAVGGVVSDSTCAACDHYTGPLRGMGDAFHVALDAVGIPQAVKAVAGDCGCGKRRAALNSALPFADKTMESQ